MTCQLYLHFNFYFWSSIFSLYKKNTAILKACSVVLSLCYRMATWCARRDIGVAPIPLSGRRLDQSKHYTGTLTHVDMLLQYLIRYLLIKEEG